MLDRRAQARARRARRSRCSAVVDAPYPRHDRAVVEADDELDRASRPCPRTPSTMRTMSGALAARRHEVDDARRRRCRSRTRSRARACRRGSGGAALAAQPARRDQPAAVLGRRRAARRSRRRSRSAASTASRSSRRGRRARRLQVADERVVLDPRHQRSSISRAKRRKRRSTPRLKAAVLLRSVLVERRSEIVAQVGEQLGPGLDEVDVVAVAFLRLVALGLVVRLLGGDAVGDHPRCSRSKRSSCRSIRSEKRARRSLTSAPYRPGGEPPPPHPR